MAFFRAFSADRPQFFDNNGAVASFGKLFWYLAGSTTKQNTFNSNIGGGPNANYMSLDVSGRPLTEIWLTGGLAYKLVCSPSTDTDPPTNSFWTEDNIRGIGDVTATTSEWTPSGFVPTYISATSFTVPGDQTSVLQPGRGLQIVDSGGTKYGWIKTSVFGALTTVVLDQNSAALASPISSVSYGQTSVTNTSDPILPDTRSIRTGSADESKQWRVELDQNTTALTRVTTVPDYDHRMMTQTHGADVASATTTVLDTATGDLVDVTGTTAITAITLAEGRMATVRFTGALTLTNGASLLLPSAANITTVAGDVAVFRGYAAGVVRCINYMRLDGSAVIPTQYKVGTFTRDNTVATGSVAYTGVGFKPKAIIFLQTIPSGTPMSIGFADASSSTVIYDNGPIVAGSYNASTSFCIMSLQSGVASHTASLSSFDTDGFTLAWTKNGGTTGTSTVYYLAFR